MKKTELLSPAKDKQTAFAAIDCGADAVYIGAPAFGARQNASNSLEDIQEVVNYAHKFWAKVFVTLNTILTDDELEKAFELTKKLEKIGIDAIIVQDMGLLSKMIKSHSSLPVHISTQADNRVSEKVSFFSKLGVSRVVLARELSLDQISKIHNENPGLEFEAFCHGALCVSYSGQCYLSQYIGGRSANRGECAQPCRKKYTIETSEGKVLKKDIYALCLKDFNASKHVKEMVEAGVYSFKIEGRLKETNYVKNVTAFYRQELDKYSKKTSSGKSVLTFTPNPEKSFNRGFTNYFLEGREDCFNFQSPKSRGEFIGKLVENRGNKLKIKTSKKLNPQDGLTNGVDGVLINKIENGCIYSNKPTNFKLGDMIFRNVDVEFEKQVSQKTKRVLGLNIEVGSVIKLSDEDGISVKLPIPQGETPNNPEKMKETFAKQFSKTGDSDFYIENFEITGNIPFLPISQINELRRTAFNLLIEKRLQEYKRQVQKQMDYANYYKKDVDYRANVHNKTAKEFYEICGVSISENSLESLKPQRQIELMRTKHCIKYALGICKSKENLQLKDEFGQIYPLKFDCAKCEMVVLSPNKL